MTISTVADVASPFESQVRSYSRLWPAVFLRAKGSKVCAAEREYLDFFAAAGSLNYGHNDADLKRALIDYLESDGILQAMDMQTGARAAFIDTLRKIVLEPRGLSDYRIVFTGPTGTNSVEAALKCARLATKRTEVLSFRNGFHGVTLGSLATTSNQSKRSGAGVELRDTSRFPFDSSDVLPEESLRWLETIHFETRSRSELPAAVLMEILQGEGGVNVPRREWVQGVAAICSRYGVPLIVDEIQMGCGRTGPFFAFEDFGIVPDIITVSKSLSGIGLPLAVALVKPALDFSVPGQHNGTFRGNNAAFITATAALSKFWSDGVLAGETRRKSQLIFNMLDRAGVSEAFEVRGKGLVIGIDVVTEVRASSVVRQCFEEGVLVETSGHRDQVVKLLPPLTIDDSSLKSGVEKVIGALLRNC